MDARSLTPESERLLGRLDAVNPQDLRSELARIEAAAATRALDEVVDHVARSLRSDDQAPWEDAPADSWELYREDARRVMGLPSFD